MGGPQILQSVTVFENSDGGREGNILNISGRKQNEAGGNYLL
jgi:hypothetical protein